jgi:hypothetical protein
MLASSCNRNSGSKDMNVRALYKVIQLFGAVSLVCLYLFEVLRILRTRLNMPTMRNVADD